jgi:anti-anti-sigma regulatory factor/anti-sigma regulatory factor (Ser/Thr protein kinase)
MSKKRRLSRQQLWTRQNKAERAKNRFKAYSQFLNANVRRRAPKPKRLRPAYNPNANAFSRQVVSIPATFSVAKDLNKVLSVIYKIKKLAESKRTKQFDFDMSGVIHIDDAAATVLISLCYDIDRLAKKVRVTWPNDPQTSRSMQQMGFRKFFEGYSPNKERLNDTLKKGKSTILQRETVPIIHKAMKTVFGEDRRNQSLQGMLIELMTNSVNHAYLNNTKEKSWYISTNHDIKNKTVEFCFVDNGDGIIQTIFKRSLTNLFLTNEEVLIQAFEGKFRSRTNLKNRGRGLVLVKNNQEKMTIRQLKVITNNVFLDFDTGVATKLDTPFQGTFYSWILDQTCK